MKAFEISGELMMAPRHWQPFAIQVAAPDEQSALEKTMALMGSRHKVKRKSIKIGNVKSLKADEITDHVVKHLLEEKK